MGFLTRLFGWLFPKKTDKQGKEATETLDAAVNLWKQTKALHDFSARTWWETMKIWDATAMVRRHEKVDYAPCEACGGELPVIAFMTEGDPRYICSRCSPEAKMAGRGSYKS